MFFTMLNLFNQFYFKEYEIVLLIFESYIAHTAGVLLTGDGASCSMSELQLPLRQPFSVHFSGNKICHVLYKPSKENY